MIDQYYTPEHIASNLLISLLDEDIKIVGDFAIGDGSLIKELPFNPETIVGLDIDSTTIKKLKKSNLTWDLKTGDFLNPNKGTQKWLLKYIKKLDLVILNPPFSCKGKKNISVQIPDNDLVMFRPYLAFVYKSLEYLNDSGILIAILPLSCIKSDIDNIAITHIKKEWDIEFGEKFGPNVFKGCSPSSIAMTIRRKKQNISEALNVRKSTNKFLKAQLLRGATQMHKAMEKGSYPVLHTTNLKNQVVTDKMSFSNYKVKYAQGSYLCIPRVCLPNKEKIVLVRNSDYLLSDCLIGIRGEDLQQTIFIRKIILDNWKTFSDMYQSTCAPYITLNQLIAFLLTFNIEATSVPCFDNNEEVDILPYKVEGVLTIEPAY